MTHFLRNVRTPFYALIGCMAFCLLSGGCGKKPEAEPTPKTPSVGSTSSIATPPPGKVSTGADPDKAPVYPSMYGKPAGAK